MTRRHLPIVLGVVTGLFVMLGVCIADFRSGFDAREKRIEGWLDATARRLEETANNRLHLVWGLDAFIQSSPDFSENDFQEFAGALESHWGGIVSLQLAPRGVVSYLTQPELNEAARGLNLLEHPTGRDAIIRAIKNREYVVAGPYQLVQGGTAIVGRMPVYLPALARGENRFWGFASVLVDIHWLLENAGLVEQQEEFDIGLRGRDGLGEKGGMFFGEPSVFDETTLKTRIALPTGSWVLAARPKHFWPGGWRWRPRLWLGGTALAVALGFIVFGLLHRPQQLKQAVRAATRALDESRRDYRRLAEVAPSGIYRSDADGNIIFANEKFREITDLKSDKISGDCWDAKIHPEDFSAAIADWSEAVKTGTSSFEYRYLHDDGRVVWVLDRATKTGEDENGYATGFIGTLTDITKVKEAQVALEAAKQNADAANHAKSEFLASISHEIRTPLNGILGMVRVMRKGSADRETHSRLAIVEQSAEVLLELLNDALDFSQVEAGRVTITEAPFEIGELVHDVAELWRAKAEEKGLRLVVDLESCPRDVRLGDAKRIRQVLSNLASNAIKFTEHGTVDIRVRMHGEQQVEFVVSDTGPGIAAGDMATIFDKFTQGDASASRRYDGTGLGLAICRQLVELMGGRIGVVSTVGEGATFSVMLPCRAVPARTPGDVTSRRNTAYEATGMLRILVAEDNPINQQVIQAILDHPGFKVGMVANGLEAVEQVQTGNYDLVLMDIRMPELDGIDAARRLRALGWSATNLPIIAVTANTSDGDRAKYLAAGMNDCVKKPIVVSELFEVITRWTDRDAVDPDADQAGRLQSNIV